MTIAIRNIVLTNDCIKLADFGLSRVIDGQKGFLKKPGTKQYQSPEILHGQTYDLKTDIWFEFHAIWSIFIFYLIE